MSIYCVVLGIFASAFVVDNKYKKLISVLFKLSLNNSLLLLSPHNRE